VRDKRSGRGGPFFPSLDEWQTGSGRMARSEQRKGNPMELIIAAGLFGAAFVFFVAAVMDAWK